MANQSPDLIHCPACGEDYAPAYRRCPFCGAKPDRSDSRGGSEEYEEPEDNDADSAPRSSGRRLVTSSAPRGGNYRGGSDFPWKPVLYVAAAVVIILAIWLLITKLLPLMPGGKATPTPTPPSQSASVAPSGTPTPTPTPPSQPASAAPTDDPVPTIPEPPTVDPDPAVSVVASVKPDDFTISKAWPDPVQLTVKGGTVTSWTSSNESVATVNDRGLVTAVGRGTATITGYLADGTAVKATARVSGDFASAAPVAPSVSPSADPGASDAPASDAPASQAPAAQPKLSTTDFTLSEANGLTATIFVRNGTAASWSSSNEAVATVNDKGLVTAVGRGTATITCTLTDGTTLKATARVSK